MKIRYQNNKTGDTFDVTELVTAAKWGTKRSGSPAKLELSVLRDEDVVWTEGGIVDAMDGDRRLFYGYVFKITQDENEGVDILAYDQTRYLKNKETYVFTGKRADQVLREIAEDFELKAGTLTDTGYVIPSMVEDAQTLFDIVLKALDLTLIHSGRMFYLWDDFGLLRVSEVTLPAQPPIVGDGSLAGGFSHSSSIDGETRNKIKLVRDNKETGKRDVYIAEDSGNMALWGILQTYEKVDENLGEGQIREQCQQMLELYNRPEQSLSLSALTLPGLRAGEVVYVALSAIGVGQCFLVEEATHDLMDETMELKVRVI